MAEQEGIIKFDLRFTSAPALPAAELLEINRWRAMLYARRLIGQSPDRYGGYGFGNISQRLPPFDAPPGQHRFVISGTQTGGVAQLGPEHYAVVTACDPDRNQITAEGPIRPSSESLTHGSVYDLDQTARVVMHTHSPEIWRSADQFGVPSTHADVAYGSAEMAAEVRRLFRSTDVQARGLFVMGGHEDGVVSFGPTADAAGKIMLDALDGALAMTKP